MFISNSSEISLIILTQSAKKFKHPLTVGTGSEEKQCQQTGIYAGKASFTG
jgi:hypothetical protein